MKRKSKSKLRKYQNLSIVATLVLAAILSVLNFFLIGTFTVETETIQILNCTSILIICYLTTLSGYITSVSFCTVYLFIYSHTHGIMNSYAVFILMVASLLTFIPIENRWYYSKKKTLIAIAMNCVIYGAIWPDFYFMAEQKDFSLISLAANFGSTSIGMILHGVLSYLFFNKCPRKIQRYFYCGRFYNAEADNYFLNIVHGKKTRLPNKISFGLVLEAVIMVAGATIFVNLLVWHMLNPELFRIPGFYYSFNLRFIFLTSSLAFPFLIIINNYSFKTISQPIILMAKAMDDFTRNTIEKNSSSVVDINLLNIHTKDEIEELYSSLKKTSTNITGYIEEIKYEQQLEEDLKIAQEANKAKSQFLSNMSHEIRTPINAILGLDEMIMRESKSPDVLSYARDIRSSSRSLLALINDILDFSKIEAGKMEIIPAQYELSSLVNDLVNMISIRAKEKNLEFNVNVDPNIPHLLYGDEVRIRQCVVNLLTNAVKYTKKGSVTLNVSFNQVSFNQITLRFQVIDTGIGIKQEDMSRLFSPFERIDEKHNRTIEGTGLGISIVKQTLELMYSHLEVKSEFGKGSNFSFGVQQIVLSHQPIGDFNSIYSEAQDNDSEFHDTFTAPEAKILFVDDTVMNLKVIKALLKRTQIQITTCESGEQCLELARKNKYDIIFIDYRMPEMDGIECLEKLKKLDPNPNKGVPCIALTANAISGAREMYLHHGFNDYLPKPVDVKRLDQMIKSYLPKELIGPPPEIEEIETGTSNLQTKIALQNKLSNQSSFISLEGIDMAQAIRNCGNREILEEAFIEYYEGIETRARQLEFYLHNKDYKNYTVQVHALKSTSRLIGAMELSQQAAYMEQCCDSQKYDEVIKNTPALLKLFRSYQKKLKPAIPQNEKENLKPLTMEHYREALSSIKEAVMAFDFDTADVIKKELDLYAIPMEVKTQWELIKEQIKNVDQAQVLDLLKDV